MNLQSKKARIPIAALGVTALCTAGLGVLASAAFAAALTATPGTTSVVITDLDPSVVTSPVNINALATYGVQIGGLTTATAVKVVATGPSAATGANLFIQAAATTPTSAGTWVHPTSLPSSLVGGTGDTVSTPTSPATTARYYIGATYPGSYTLKFYQEGSAGSATAFDGDSIDNAVPTITLDVKDVNGITTTSSDDLGLSLSSVPSAIDKGETVSSTATVSDLTTTDVRGVVGSGTYPSAGALGNALIGPLSLTYSLNGGATDTGSGLVYTGSTYKNSSTAAGAAGSLVTTAAIGSGISKQATATVTDNTITALAYTPTPGVAVGNANTIYTSATATRVRAGTTAVTYKVLATNSSSQPAVGKTVFFRLSDTGSVGSGIDLADLTTSAGTPDSQGDVGVTTDSNGQASLTVNVPAAKAINGAAFGIRVRSNGIYASAGTTATYETAAPSTISVNSTAALVGTTSTITGKVLDQFGEAISPAGVSATITRTAGTFTPSSGTYPLNSSGVFTATVTDAGSTTVAHTDTFSVAVPSATTVTGKSVAWLTSVTPATASITTIDSTTASNVAIPFAVSTTRVPLTDSTGITSATLSGTIKDSSANGLPYASVTYSGSDGVYFQDSTGKLVKTLTAPTTSSGALASGSSAGVEVVFTKSGSATLTILAGAATTAVTLPVADSTESWKVIAQDAKSKPGQSITLLGKVSDAFDNPTVGRQVTLSLSTPAAGSFSGTDANATLAGFQVVTDTTGVWSTPFTSTSNQNGTVTLTATLANNTSPPNANLATNPVASGAAAYSAAGLTIAHGEYQDTADIQVVDPATGIAVTNQLLGGGKAQISGTAEAGASVDLYARASGESGFELVKTLTADPTGMWGVGSTINKTTSYFARSGGKTSDTVTTVVYSIQTVKAKALGKGMVRFTVYGTPNVRGVVNIYIGSTRLAHAGTDSHGDATVDVQSKAGRRTFKIYFVAPGTSTKGTSLTGTVK